MSEGFSALTQAQKKSYITSFLYHMSDLEDISDWEPERVEGIGSDIVKVHFSDNRVYYYKNGAWDE